MAETNDKSWEVAQQVADSGNRGLESLRRRFPGGMKGAQRVIPFQISQILNGEQPKNAQHAPDEGERGKF